MMRDKRDCYLMRLKREKEELGMFCHTWDEKKIPVKMKMFYTQLKGNYKQPRKD